MVQALWQEREQLAATKEALWDQFWAYDKAGDTDGCLTIQEEQDDFGAQIYDLDGEIADIVPQSLNECLIHARLLATEWSSDATTGSRDAIDTRLAKSLLAGLESLARKAEP